MRSSEGDAADALSFLKEYNCEELKAPSARGAETGYNGYKLYWTNCLPSDSLGLENTHNLSAHMLASIGEWNMS